MRFQNLFFQLLSTLTSCLVLAFVNEPSSLKAVLTTWPVQQPLAHQISNPLLSLWSTRHGSQLEAKKAKVSPEEQREPPSAMTLFVTYMTPWKNPNSIFAYMLIILIALGKYSETHVITK